MSPGDTSADIAAEVDLDESTIITAAMRNAVFDLLSQALTVDSNGNFAVNSLQLAGLGGTFDVDIPGVTSGSSFLYQFVADNGATTSGTVTTDSNGVEITIPLSAELVITDPSGVFTTTLQLTGQIVASAATSTPNDLADNYDITLAAGQTIQLATQTPLDQVSNTLDPQIAIYDADNNLLASDDNSASDGKNAVLSFTAPAAGTYRILVSGQSGTGEYVLDLNQAPLASLAGPTVAVPGQTRTFTLTATDDSSVNQRSDFTFAIDWDGDGQVDQTVAGPSGVQVDHVFTDTGSFDVTVTATDRRGAVSDSASQTVDVSNVALEADADNPSQTDLFFGGTAGDDQVAFTQLDATTVQVQITELDGVTVSQTTSYSDITGHVSAYGLDGNDTLDGSALTAIAMTAYAGTGNTTITGGGGRRCPLRWHRQRFIGWRRR